MNYLQKKFSVHLGQSDSFRDNYDRAFGKQHTPVEPLPDPLERDVSTPTEIEDGFVFISLSLPHSEALRLLEDIDRLDSSSDAKKDIDRLDSSSDAKKALQQALRKYFNK